MQELDLSRIIEPLERAGVRVGELERLASPTFGESYRVANEAMGMSRSVLNAPERRLG
jgi:hypothetical protein